MLPSALIDRALERAPSSITEATRELLFELFDVGTLGDDGALALAAGTFPKLERIDVSRNYLTEAGITALSRIARHVEVCEQREDDGDPENRYIAAFE